MKKVRALSNFYGNEGMVRTGDIIEVSASRAKELVEAGLASFVEDSPEANTQTGPTQAQVQAGPKEKKEK